MFSSRLFWKIFLVYAGLNLTLAAGFMVVATVWQRGQVIQQVQRQLHDTAIVLRSHVEPQIDSAAESAKTPAREQARDTLQLLVKRLSAMTHTRMTLVAENGEVIADSDEDPRSMQNHRNREELKAARGDEALGVSSRRSPTLGIRMLYVALPVEQDGRLVAFVRVAMALTSIDEHASAIQSFLWLLAGGTGLLALVLTYLMVGRIVGPLAQLTRSVETIAAGDYEQQVMLHRRDELGTLAAAVRRMQSDLAMRVNELQESNAQLNTVLGSMSEGVMAVDSQLRIILANAASRRMLDFATQDATGRPLLEVTRSRPIEQAVSNAFRREGTIESVLESTGPLQRIVLLRAASLPGDPTPGVVVVLHDITELRRLENLRRELVANVSHELKTPLAAIKAYAETLRLGAVNDPENNVEFVRRIEEQADRLHQLILDLLHLARIESGEEAFDITDVAVAKVVESCAVHHAEAAKAKQIELSTDPPERPVHVRADETALRTILDNLIDNAVKYTPEGGRVQIRWRTDQAMAVLTVEDTGIGIDPREQPRVFERFFRADKARSRELGGTGLGLAIVKHLTQAFGGSVSLSSTPGEGSRFEVRLPLS